MGSERVNTSVSTLSHSLTLSLSHSLTLSLSHSLTLSPKIKTVFFKCLRYIPISEIKSATDIDSYIKFYETENQKKEAMEIIALESKITEALQNGKSQKELRKDIDKIRQLRRKRDLQDAKLIRESFVGEPGKTTKIMVEAIERSIDKIGLDKNEKQLVINGTEYAGRIMDTYGIDTKRLPPKIVRKDVTPSYDPIANVLDIDKTKEISETVVHEFGHYLEENVKSVREKCKQFFADITDGQEERFLAIDFPKKDYDLSLKYKKASIPMPEYALCIYSDGGTELLSEGLELLYQNPLKLANQYPQYFNFIMEMLNHAK